LGTGTIKIIFEKTLMLVVLRPEAEQELLEAQAWYESKALGLGFEFARAADAAVASALRNPSGTYVSKKSSVGRSFVSSLTRSSISQTLMSCSWFRSFISIVNRVFGLSGLVAEQDFMT
jgi:hypothetical protein